MLLREKINRKEICVEGETIYQLFRKFQKNFIYRFSAYSRAISKHLAGRNWPAGRLLNASIVDTDATAI